jgi:AcrR family transcriptional regulator
MGHIRQEETRRFSSDMLATRGQTRNADKRQQILAAAARLFMSQGFGATSMDAVAREAGVSKATVYAHFEGKEALFAANVAVECEKLRQALQPPMQEVSDVAAMLRQFGAAFLDLVYGPKGIAVYRIMTAEAERFPALGRAFYESGPARVLEALAMLLERAAARGLLHLADPREAAEQFIALLRGERHLRQLLGIAPALEAEEKARLLEVAIRVFLKAYAP